MNMCQVAVKIPDAVLFDTHMTESEADSFVKQTLALHYYIKCHISLGYCAEIAGMTKEDFIKFLGKNGISIFNYENKNELMEELTNA
jgi:predicted HTH domain antitoxin